MAECQSSMRGLTTTAPYVIASDDLSAVGKRAVQRLPLMQRLVWAYHYEEGKPFIEIADTLVHLVEPQGAAVYLEASHMCTEMRGVEERSRTSTTFWRGVFADPELRREFLAFVR